MRLLTVITSFGLVLSQWVQAQTAMEPDTDYQRGPVFSAEVDLVNVSVVALDRNNHPLSLLEKQNFKIEERIIGKTEFREVEFELEKPESLPLRGGVSIDTSGSTSNQFLYQLDVASEIVKWIFRDINNTARGDRFFVAEYYYETLDKDPSTGYFVLKQDWTNDTDNLVRSIIRGIKRPAGNSPLFLNVRSSAEKFSALGGNFANFLILISDGENNVTLPDLNLEDSTYVAQRANLPIYTIGTASHDSRILSTNAREDFEENLKQISQLTGGRFFDLPKQEEIPEIAGQILLDLRNRYQLSYKLNPAYRDGDEIEIRVSIGSAGQNGRWRQIPAQLLHRKGYRVLKKN